MTRVRSPVRRAWYLVRSEERCARRSRLEPWSPREEHAIRAAMTTRRRAVCTDPGRRYDIQAPDYRLRPATAEAVARPTCSHKLKYDIRGNGATLGQHSKIEPDSGVRRESTTTCGGLWR